MELSTTTIARQKGQNRGMPKGPAMLIATTSRSENLLLHTMVLCLTLFSPAHADEVYTVCIGDRNTCEGSPWFLCGTSIDQAAQAVCTTPTATKQEVSHYTFIKLRDLPGGRCGYAVFQVTCKK
jgi:hypothetical protein